MMLLIVAGAAAIYLFGMGGMSQIQNMISGGGGSSGAGGVNVGLDSGINVGGIHVGLDGIHVPGIVDIGGPGGVISSSSGGLNGVGNQIKVQRNVDTTGQANQSNTFTQNHRIIQQNGKTIFESNLGRVSYN